MSSSKNLHGDFAARPLEGCIGFTHTARTLPRCLFFGLYADAGYLGVEKREEIATGHAGVEWHVAAKRGKIQAMAEGLAKEMAQQVERLKAQVRARVEHPFHILKNIFRHRKTRDRGLAKILRRCIASSL